MILLLSICALSFFIKNTIRIVSNYDTKFYQSPWPRIYNNKDELNQTNEKSNYPVNFKKTNKNGLLNAAAYKKSHIFHWIIAAARCFKGRLVLSSEMLLREYT